jgi:predicted PurR-regulated permease PerM
MPKSDPQSHSNSLRNLVNLAMATLVVVVLWFGYDFLMPMALALLLSFLLWPLTERLERWRIPHVVAVTAVSLSAAALVLAGTIFVSLQIKDVLGKLPDYKENLVQKVRGLRGTGDGLTRLNETIKDLQQEMATTTAPSTAEAGLAEVAPKDTPAATQPVPVVLQEDTNLLAVLQTYLERLTGPLGMAGMVFVVLMFILMDHDLIQDRIRWASRRYRIWAAVDALDEAAGRVGRYLRVQLIINVSYGAIVSVAMLAIGLPNAILWGVIAAVLRYIPYVGPWAAAVAPILLSVAVFPDWSRPLIVAGAFVAAETITNGIMEPWLYGTSTGVSSLGVVIATFFWGWVWGPVGLVLAMPITVCLVVIGRHIEPLAPLALLLSSDELSPEPKKKDEPSAAVREPEAAPDTPPVGVDTEPESGLI